MGYFVTTQDFENTEMYKIVFQGYRAGELDALIVSIENGVLIKCLGYNLFDAFVSDFDTNTKTPTSPRFQALWIRDYGKVNSFVYEYEGLKEMIMQRVYHDFNVNQINKTTTQGKQAQKVSVSYPSPQDVYIHDWNTYASNSNTIRKFIIESNNENSLYADFDKTGEFIKIKGLI